MLDLGIKDMQTLQNNPKAIMCQALFISNFLNLPQHFMSEKFEDLEPAPFKEIWAKTAVDAEWVPTQLLVDRRGYGLMSFQDGHQQWIPGRWVKDRRTD